MPLRCFDPSVNRSVLAFDLSREEWRALQRENRRARHLRMPCCQAQVTLKRSHRGTPFFAHKSVGECATAPETEAHLRLKRIAVEAARMYGWDAETEVTGRTAKGEQWRADVLAQRARSRVAIEIQWSSQTNEETLCRQARYVESGVRCLWLFRHGGFPVSRDLPAVRVDGNPDEGFVAFIPTGSGEQSLPVHEFFDAAFNKRFRFGLPLGCDATVSVQAGPLLCYRCDAETRIVTGIAIDVGPDKHLFTVPDLDAHLDLFERIRGRIPDSLGIGSIKRRYSKTQKRSYLSNGCAHCGAFIGEFYEHGAWYDAETVCEFQTRMDENWQAAIEQREDYEEGWGIYSMG